MARPQRDTGMVTAETAVVLPFLAAFGLLLVWVVSIGMTQVRLVDASREGARMLARGDAMGEVREVVREIAPRGARIAISTTGGYVTVTVSGTGRIDLPLVGGLTRVRLDARAVAAHEGQ